jgi:hypothetical protein
MTHTMGKPDTLSVGNCLMGSEDSGDVPDRRGHAVLGEAVRGTVRGQRPAPSGGRNVRWASEVIRAMRPSSFSGGSVAGEGQHHP